MKEKIKVLQIGMSGNQGGIETYIYNLYKNSNKDEFQFDFIDISNDKIAFYDELVSDGANIYKVIGRDKNYFEHISQLKNIIKKNNYNIIHIHIMDYSWFEPIVIASKYSKAKIILHSHSANNVMTWNQKHKMLHKIGKWLCKNVKAEHVACGKKAGEFMFPNQIFTILNNGIDLDKFKYNYQYNEELRKELKIAEKSFIIGQVAKLDLPKNPLFLLEIFNEYKKKDINAKLVVVGEGPQKKEMEEKIKEYNLGQDVFLLGRRDDCYKIYSMFDLFLMPSLYEGFSISLVEAQANGLKCYTSDEVDEDSNITGNVQFISLEKNAGFWADQILNSKNERDRNAQEKIPDKFDFKNSYEMVYEVYRSGVENENN